MGIYSMALREGNCGKADPFSDVIKTWRGPTTVAGGLYGTLAFVVDFLIIADV